MKIYLIWVWWIWLSAIAQILHNLWYSNIVWIDQSESEITEKLKKQWIKIIIWHWKVEILPEDIVIYSDAAASTPEVQNAKRKLSYFDFIHRVSTYFKTIAIAGTHWKSTTTALTLYTMKNLYSQHLALGIVWALVPDLNNKNYFLNQNLKKEIKQILDHILTGKWKNFDYDIIKKYFFVIEADEFNHHFLSLDPDWAIITNIDWDHTDIYKTFDQYLENFHQFVNLVKNFVVIPSNLKNLLKPFKNKLKTVEKLQDIHFKYIFGQHNILNANLVIKLLSEIFWENNNYEKILENFRWLWRRLEFLGSNKNWTLIFTDYAHHPTELKAILQSLKEKYPNKKLIVIFQPHQARRVIQFFNDFVEILKKFDKNFVYKIYAARENLDELKKLFKEKDFLKNINDFDQLAWFLANKSWGLYLTNFEQVKNIIKKATSNDIVIIATAGDLDYLVRKNLWTFSNLNSVG